MKTDIQIKTDITIRPSSLKSLLMCPWQWFNVFILGKTTIPNARAIIGTGVHAGAEYYWNDAIKKKHKEGMSKDELVEVSIDKYDKIIKDTERINYNDIEDDNQARTLVKQGIGAYFNDIVPFTPIPKAVEVYFEIPIEHKIVSKFAGTVDQLGTDIYDIKTMKRTMPASTYALQQTAYRLLAERNNHTVNNTYIQNVVFNKSNTSGSISDLETKNTSQVTHILNVLLKRLDAFYSGVDPRLLFAGNTENYLCSPKYCSLYNSCQFVQGKDDEENYTYIK